MRYVLVPFALTALVATAAHADGDYPSPTGDRVRVSLGLMQDTAATSFVLDNGMTAGSFIDGENTLGLDARRVTPKFAVEVRSGAVDRIRLDYLALDRDDTKPLSGSPLVYGGETFLVGDPIESNVSVRAFGLTYAHSFIHNERFELAATIGVTEMDIDARLQVQTATTHIDVDHSLAGPVPMPGIEATWVVSKRFYLDARGAYLKGARHQLSAEVDSYEFDALYRLRPNISFALGYSGFRADLTSRRSGDSGFADFSTRGPQLLVRVEF
jgi:hypothetical protein